MKLLSLSLQHNRNLRYAAFFYLYVMQGIPAGFALTAVANYLTASGHSPQTIGKFIAIVGLPWVIQFVWGPVIDRFQNSAMGRRRPWVLLSQLLALCASLGLLFIREPAEEIFALSLAFFVHSVFASVQDASVDALAISSIPPSERGRVNAFMRGGMLFGTGVGAAALSSLLRGRGFFSAALAQSLVLLTMTIVTFFIKEAPADSLLPRLTGRRRGGGRGRDITAPGPGEMTAAGPVRAMSWRHIYGELFRGFFSSQSLRLFGAVICVYLCASVFIRAFSVHLIQRLRWEDTSLSVLTGTYGMVVAMAAILVAGLLSDRIGTRRLLMAMMFIIGSYLVAFNLMSPLWPNTALAQAGLILWYTFDPGYSVAAMPVLMALCREGVEGSQFTTYMALVNLSDVVGAYVSGYALSLVSAPVIGFLCGVVVLATLAVLRRTALGRESAA